jgi:hypothetical protein
MAYPATAPSIAHADISEVLSNMHGGLGHVEGTNEIIDLAVALAAKVGTGASTPVANSTLVGNGTGTSAWLAGLTQAYLASGSVGAAQLIAGTTAFQKIGADVTGAGNPTVLSFTSIPATYKSLMIVGHARANTGAGSVQILNMTLNADGGNNYGWNYVYYLNTSAPTMGASAGAAALMSLAYITDAAATAAEHGSFLIWIPDYAGVATRKNVQSFFGLSYSAGASLLGLGNGRWTTSASAIATATLAIGGGLAFHADSKASLYGLPA